MSCKFCVFVPSIVIDKSPTISVLFSSLNVSVEFSIIILVVVPVTFSVKLLVKFTVFIPDIFVVKFCLDSISIFLVSVVIILIDC